MRNAQRNEPAKCLTNEWKRLALFKGLTAVDLQTVESSVRLKNCAPGTVLLTTQRNSDFLYVLLSGRVKVYVEAGQDFFVTLAFRYPGELLGEISAIDGDKPSANVVTDEACSVLVMEKEHFLHCLQTMPPLGFNVARVLARRVRLATTHIGTLSTMDTRCRVARQLVALAVWSEPVGSEPARSKVIGNESMGQESTAERRIAQGVLPLRLTQQDLAEMVGCSRAQVNRAIVHFRNEGLIVQQSDKTWVILDQFSLNGYCE